MRREAAFTPSISAARRTALPIGLLVALVTLTWLPRFAGPIDLRWDAAVYYCLGTSLAQGKGLRLINEPGEIRGVQYPPGLPAVVAVHQRLLGTSNPVVVGKVLRGTYFVLSAVYILAVYWYLKRPIGSLAALGAASICAVGMNFVWLSDRLYSDLPFLVVTTLFFLLARGAAASAQWGAGLAASTAFALRSLGAALLIAWVADAAIARNRKALLARIAVAALVIGSWQGYVLVVQRSSEYQTPAYAYQRAPYLLYNVSYVTNASLKVPFAPEQGHATMRDVAVRFVRNAIDLPSTIGEVISTSAMNWAAVLQPVRELPVLGLLARWKAIQTGLVLLGLVTLAGVWQQWRLKQVREVVFVVCYVIAVCVMNFTGETPRYLMGLQPLFLLMALSLLPGGLEVGGSAARRAFTALVVLAIVAANVVTVRNAYAQAFSPVTHRHWLGTDVSYRLFSYPDAFRSFDAGIDWLNAHAAADAVIASSQPHWVFLRTGRRAVMPPFERNPTVHQALLDSVPVTYVIVDRVGFSPTLEYSLPVLADRVAWARTYAAADGSVAVYRRTRSEADAGMLRPQGK